MKKRFILFVSVVLSVVFLFGSCSSLIERFTNKDNSSDSEKTDEITKEDWKKAFELDGVTSFTVVSNVNFADGEECTSEFKYEDNKHHYVCEWNYEGETEKITDYGYNEEGLESILSLDDYLDDMFVSVSYVLSEYDDYAFNEFTLNDDGYFEFTKTDDYFNEELTIKIYFNSDKLIEKFLVSLEYDDGIDEGEIVFSNYNNTVGINLPYTEIQNLFWGYPGFPYEPAYLSAAMNYEIITISDQKAFIDDLIDFVPALDPYKATRFFKGEEGPNDYFYTVVLENEGATLKLGEIEFVYDTIEIDFMYTKFNIEAKNSNGDNLYISIEI